MIPPKVCRCHAQEMLSQSKSPEKGECHLPATNKEAYEGQREGSCSASIILGLFTQLQLSHTLTQLPIANMSSSCELQTPRNAIFLRSLFCNRADTSYYHAEECQFFFLYYLFFSFFKFLLLFNYSCMPFLPIPLPHPSQTHLPPPPPPSPLILSMCPLQQFL